MSLKTRLNNILWSILLFFIPITFVFSQDKYIDTKSRVLFIGESIFKFAPIFYLYQTLYNWYATNETFATSLVIVLSVNAIIGVRYHMKMRTLSIKEFITSTFTMLAMILGVYLILRAFGNVMGHNIIGDTYMRVIEFITLLYPGSKVLQNVFILSNGKHPPLFVMKALYAYQKDGKVQQFINAMTGSIMESEKNSGADNNSIQETEEHSTDNKETTN